MAQHSPYSIPSEKAAYSPSGSIYINPTTSLSVMYSSPPISSGSSVDSKIKTEHPNANHEVITIPEHVFTTRPGYPKLVPPIVATYPQKSIPYPGLASRWTRFSLWFNTYRKLFVMALVLNSLGLLLAGLDRFPYAKKNAGAMALGNLMVAVLVRNEVFGRLLYLTVNNLFAYWPPLIMRLGISSVLQHLGGIHSGCALSSISWLIFKFVLICLNPRSVHPAIIALSVITFVVVMGSAAAAYPWVRNNHHNVFERLHRFVGWVGVFLSWAFVVLSSALDPITGWRGTHGGRVLIRTQDFWFLLALSILVALPWTYTRKVAVEIEIPSEKVAVIRFERGMQQGLLGRVGRSYALEYHAFGIISESKDAKYHYMVCGVQGDFTRNLVSDPPTHLYTRELKFAGIGNTSAMYRRGIRIATGTGIGAALSTCLQSPNWFLIWIGSDVEKTFGKTIQGLIERGIEPERRILWDTKKLKRPDTMRLLKDTYDSWGAEVVFITSNLQGNQQMMEGCKMLGIPAFGTLWDF